MRPNDAMAASILLSEGELTTLYDELHRLGRTHPEEVKRVVTGLYGKIFTLPPEEHWNMRDTVVNLLNYLRWYGHPTVARAAYMALEAANTKRGAKVVTMAPATMLYLFRRGLEHNNASLKTEVNRLHKRREYVALATMLQVPFFNHKSVLKLAKKKLGDYELPVLLYLARYGDDFRKLLRTKDMIPYKFGEHSDVAEKAIRALESKGLKVARTADQHARYLARFLDSCYVPANAYGVMKSWGYTVISGPILVVAYTKKEKSDTEERILARAAVPMFLDDNGRYYFSIFGVWGREEFAKMLEDKIKDALLSIGMRRRSPDVPVRPLPGPWKERREIPDDDYAGILTIPPRRDKEVAKSRERKIKD